MDPDAALAPVAAAQLGVFTLAQARAAHWSRGQLHRRVAAKRVRRMHAGVFADNSAPRTWAQRVLAAVFAGGDGAVASHVTAAALHGFPDAVQDRIEVSVPSRRNPRLRGVPLHRVALESYDVTRVGPIPVTTVARTLVDCCGLLSLGQVARALDDALVRQRTTLWAVQRSLDGLGSGRLRRRSMLQALLDERDPVVQQAESRPEIRVYRALVRAGLPAPVLQHPVTVDGWRFRLDLAYPHARLGIEYQGFDAHRSRTAQDHDFRRHRLLTTAGWTLLFVTGATSDDELVSAVAPFVA
jgi:predicted transcriptional regulator of viral defense system